MDRRIGSPDSHLHYGYQTAAGKPCACRSRRGDSEDLKLQIGSLVGGEAQRKAQHSMEEERDVRHKVVEIDGNDELTVQR